MYKSNLAAAIATAFAFSDSAGASTDENGGNTVTTQLAVEF